MNDSKTKFMSPAWAVLSDEQMSNGYPFSLLNDEQMSSKVRVEHQPAANVVNGHVCIEVLMKISEEIGVF